MSKTYTIKKIKGSVKVNGRGDDPNWKHAVVLTEFGMPWDMGHPQKTSFRSVHDEDWVYFAFDAEDNHINVYTGHDGKQGAVRSDRVEIFFKKDDEMNPYYCLEMDPLARVFDCKAEYYRKIDTTWSWPAGDIELRSHQRSDGYTVELKISKKSLVDLGLLKDNRVLAGLFRADCVELNDKHSEYKWVSWIDPQSPTPDFHIPGAFGTLVLE